MSFEGIFGAAGTLDPPVWIGLKVTVRDGQKTYICGSSSIYVSLHVSGVYTTIHIHQHLDGMEEIEKHKSIVTDFFWQLMNVLKLFFWIFFDFLSFEGIFGAAGTIDPSVGIGLIKGKLFSL